MDKASYKVFPRGNPQCAVRLRKKKKILGKKWKRREEEKLQLQYNCAVGPRGIQRNMKMRKRARSRWSCDASLALYEKSRRHPQGGNLRRVQRCRLSGAPTAESRDTQSCKTMRGVKVPSALFCQSTVRYYSNAIKSCAIYYAIASEWAVVTGHMPSNHQI